MAVRLGPTSSRCRCRAICAAAPRRLPDVLRLSDLPDRFALVSTTALVSPR